MSIQVYQDHYTEEDYTKYQERIREQLDVLAELTRIPGFGGSNYHLGGTVGYYLIDSEANVKPNNKEVLIQAGEARLKLPLNKYQIDMNLSPVETDCEPFQSLEQELDELGEIIEESANNLNTSVIPVGILPTLKRTDVSPANMTNIQPHRALKRGLEKVSGKLYQIHIEGDNPLNLNCNDISLEGANGTCQFNLKTPLKYFTDTWNALQLITPIVLGISGNSPLLFGHRLWQDTRIALLNHSHRLSNRHKLWDKPARVNYGQGWLRNGPCELFSENVALFEPVLPVVYPKEVSDSIVAGEVPSLDELRLHQSTVLSWNRVIYDTSHDGYFQIQSRSLPAGPSNQDMIANIAFMTGLTLGFREQMSFLTPEFPFELAEQNFYHAAQHGLQANVLWPETTSNGAKDYRLIDLAKQLMATAERGLSSLGVANSEITQYLDIIQNRLDRQVTGAIWQSETLSYYFQNCDLDVALKRMLQDYILEYRMNKPVSEWERPR